MQTNAVPSFKKLAKSDLKGFQYLFLMNEFYIETIIILENFQNECAY